MLGKILATNVCIFLMLLIMALYGSVTYAAFTVNAEIGTLVAVLASPIMFINTYMCITWMFQIKNNEW